MAVKYEIVAAGEKYTDREGNEKTHYIRMGVVLEMKSGGLLMKCESIPVNWNGLAYLNYPKDKEESRNSSMKNNREKDLPDYDEDIPF